MKTGYLQKDVLRITILLISIKQMVRLIRLRVMEHVLDSLQECM
nr:MAG TPA: hypothetical protein [Caudoviricetes sp.]